MLMSSSDPCDINCLVYTWRSENGSVPSRNTCTLVHCQTDCWTKYLNVQDQLLNREGYVELRISLVPRPHPLSRGKGSGDQWATEEVEHCWTLLIKKAGLSLIDVEYFNLESFFYDWIQLWILIQKLGSVLVKSWELVCWDTKIN